MNTLLLILSFFYLAPPASSLEMSIHFDHTMHLEKVFKTNKISCTHCHNFDVDSGSNQIKLTDETKKSILKLTYKQICHECHQSSLPKYNAAPKNCITCHKGMEGLAKVKPLSHESSSWKTAHAAEARVSGDACTKCHMTSQCAKCHLQREDIQLTNHSRNFKFFHSVEARARPQSCDACHTKTFCTNCHLGKK
ncbi:MAG: cytochrome c3 family protein [Bdellovibrionota bacterium]